MKTNRPRLAEARDTAAVQGALPPFGVASAPLTGPQRVPVTTQALTSAVTTGWFHPFMKSACSVVIDPSVVGPVETVSPLAVEVG
jgi:hypothetical protein